MTLFTQQISVTGNDGRDINSASFDDTYLSAGVDSFSGDTSIAALRFTGVMIPNGATVSSATLTIFSAGADDGTATGVTLYGVAEDNCAAFSGSNLPSAKAHTSATAAVGHGGAEFTQYDIDITSTVQEIIGRGGWASGNAIAFVITASGGLAIWQDFSGIRFPTFWTPASISITHSGAGGSTYNEAVNEGVAPADSADSTLISTNVTESVTAADSLSVSAVFVTTISEAVTPGDQVSFSVNGWTYGAAVTTTWDTQAAGSSIWTPIIPASTSWS